MAEPIEMPFGLRTRVRPRNYVLHGGQHPPWEGAILREEEVAHCNTWGHSAVICAKTAEPIDLPFGLWTRVDQRKHRFNCIRQVEPGCPLEPMCPMGGHIGVTWKIRLNHPSAAAMRPYVKLL